MINCKPASVNDKVFLLCHVFLYGIHEKEADLGCNLMHRRTFHLPCKKTPKVAMSVLSSLALRKILKAD